jgi:hypothetical protein
MKDLKLKNEVTDFKNPFKGMKVPFHSPPRWNFVKKIEPNTS